MPKSTRRLTLLSAIVTSLLAAENKPTWWTWMSACSRRVWCCSEIDILSIPDVPTVSFHHSALVEVRSHPSLTLLFFSHFLIRCLVSPQKNVGCCLVSNKKVRYQPAQCRRTSCWTWRPRTTWRAWWRRLCGCACGLRLWRHHDETMGISWAYLKWSEFWRSCDYCLVLFIVKWWFWYALMINTNDWRWLLMNWLVIKKHMGI